MATTAKATGKLTTFYGQMTSLDRVLESLRRHGVDLEHLRARDLYERDLDCQNLGAFRMLDVIAAAVAERAMPHPDDAVLDVGCGMGGPGRFLVDRFGCSVTGIDLLPMRIRIAEELTARTGLADRISYRAADTTNLPFKKDAFAQVWMLDVGIHVLEKTAMFGEIARVLRPGGLFVMHDQMGPLPKSMSPLMRLAPYRAPTLPQLIRYVEGAGLRLLAWQDTTALIVAYFQQIRARHLPDADASGSQTSPRRDWMRQTTDAYLATLDGLDGRTGILIAERRP